LELKNYKLADEINQRANDWEVICQWQDWIVDFQLSGGGGDLVDLHDMVLPRFESGQYVVKYALGLRVNWPAPVL